MLNLDLDPPFNIWGFYPSMSCSKYSVILNELHTYLASSKISKMPPYYRGVHKPCELQMRSFADCLIKKIIPATIFMM